MMTREVWYVAEVDDDYPGGKSGPVDGHVYAVKTDALSLLGRLIDSAFRDQHRNYTERVSYKQRAQAEWDALNNAGLARGPRPEDTPPFEECFGGLGGYYTRDQLRERWAIDTYTLNYAT